MGLRRNKEPKPLTRGDLPTMQQVAAMGRDDQLKAWQDYREVALREAAEAGRANRRAAAKYKGQPAHPDGPLREDELPTFRVPIVAHERQISQTPPEWWGQQDGLRWDPGDADIIIDRDGYELVRDPETGRLTRVDQPKQPKGAYIGDAKRSGAYYEPREVTPEERARGLAEHRGIPIEQARAEIEAFDAEHESAAIEA